jgi:hypothetical protein
VLDLMTLLFSPEQHEILKAGTKILLAVEPPEVLLRMVPNERLPNSRAGRSGAAQGATEMRVTSAAGTDLRCPYGDYPITAEYGSSTSRVAGTTGPAASPSPGRTKATRMARIVLAQGRHPAADEVVRQRADHVDRARRAS